MNKRQKYLSVKKQVFKITDKLGKPIDKGIREVIIYLNLLGVETTQSCEGHGIGHFFIDFRFFCYQEMNGLLTECFGRNRPVQYTFYMDNIIRKEMIIRLVPIITSEPKQAKKDLCRFEMYLKNKYKTEPMPQPNKK